jgi:hypothetical protein
MNERIEITDSCSDVVVKMSDGNLGAIDVLMRLLRHSAVIDPQAMLGPMSAILAFDRLGIYGAGIWVLYNDRCERRLPWLLGLLRANQLGFVTDEYLRDLADCTKPHAKEMLASAMIDVQSRLEEFRLNEGPQ